MSQTQTTGDTGEPRTDAAASPGDQQAEARGGGDEPSHGERARGEHVRGERSETERAEDVMESAEEVMEKVGERVGDWVSRAVARTREEAEDIWADAQAVRRGGDRT